MINKTVLLVHFNTWDFNFINFCVIVSKRCETPLDLYIIHSGIFWPLSWIYDDKVAPMLTFPFLSVQWILYSYSRTLADRYWVSLIMENNNKVMVCELNLMMHIKSSGVILMHNGVYIRRARFDTDAIYSRPRNLIQNEFFSKPLIL